MAERGVLTLIAAGSSVAVYGAGGDAPMTSLLRGIVVGAFAYAALDLTDRLRRRRARRALAR